ncbi:hypothetical protein FGO68_gene14932 [Halteria grandinella]|uniref:Uncharacterized protein n=1 Tax=Halteria grandinella TaxID=5974 RepID=A0A8J8N9Y8_HALGN|nr:hypothetical protein FGO68_gene14932 [Halteria grandinella]
MKRCRAPPYAYFAIFIDSLSTSKFSVIYYAHSESFSVILVREIPSHKLHGLPNKIQSSLFQNAKVLEHQVHLKVE